GRGALRPGRGDVLRELRPLPAPFGVRQPRLAVALTPPPSARRNGARPYRRDRRTAGYRRPVGPPGGSAVQRAAAARRPRPCPGPPRACVSPRRAALPPRREAAP